VYSSKVREGATGALADALRKGNHVVSPPRDPRHVLDNTIQPGGSIKSSQLVQNDRQLLYLVQELKDGDTDLQSQVDTAIDTNLAERAKDAVGGIMRGSGSATDDTTAFQALAAFVQAAGGGTIILRPAAVYLVGRQSLVNDGTYMWKGENILTLAGLTRPFLIRGNGARLKLAAGLKIGTFNAAGAATAPALPYFGNNRSQPVIEGVVDIQNCTAAVALENFEVDGNEANLNWGGQFGDTGWQVGGDGLFLKNNTGGIRLVNVHAHDCPRDSLDVNDGPVPFAKASYQSPSVAIGCRFIRSVRQAMSFVGGGGWSFIGCRFTGTGTGSHASAPIAGIDLEAEGGAIIRDIHFINCTIGDTNTGVAALSVGDVEGVVFDRCRFLGLTSWTTYGWNKAAFNDCFFLGSMVAMTNTKFNRCTLSDDTTKSPTGTVYLGTGYIPDFGGVGTGCVFDECVWDLVGAGRAGLGGVDWTCRNCTIGFGPTAGGPSFMRPRWEGINILGPGFNHVNTDDMGAVAIGGDIIYLTPSPSTSPTRQEGQWTSAAPATASTSSWGRCPGSSTRCSWPCSTTAGRPTSASRTVDGPPGGPGAVALEDRRRGLGGSVSLRLSGGVPVCRRKMTLASSSSRGW
jgi:hypothetical protein